MCGAPCSSAQTHQQCSASMPSPSLSSLVYMLLVERLRHLMSELRQRKGKNEYESSALEYTLNEFKYSWLQVGQERQVLDTAGNHCLGRLHPVCQCLVPILATLLLLPAEAYATRWQGKAKVLGSLPGLRLNSGHLASSWSSPCCFRLWRENQ